MAIKVSELPLDNVLDAADKFFVTTSGNISAALTGQALMNYFVEEAPADGFEHVRWQETWVRLAAYILDVPNDGNQYVREFESWVLREPWPFLDLTLYASGSYPAWQEGRVFYDEDNHGLAVYSDIPEVTWQVGQEHLVRVFNDSGVSIGNAVPVRQIGVINNLPSVVPAQADLVITSVVLGMTTHVIPDQTEGFITARGQLGADFSGYTPGDSLYLSDTVPGGVIAVSPGSIGGIPDLATRVGSVLGAGTMNVEINSLTSLPNAIAYMNGALDPPGGSIDNVYQPVDNFQDSGGVILVPDPTGGRITVPVSGVYRVTFNMSLTFTSTAQDRVLSLQMWDEILLQSLFVIPTTLIKDTASQQFTISAPFSGDANSIYSFRITSTTAISGVVYQFTSYDIASVHLT